VVDTDGDGNANEPGENDPTPATIPTPGVATIGDIVFEDLNGDGIQDIGEPGVAGVTVQVLDGAGNTVDTLVTDANGNWSLDVLPGEYIVVVVEPAGFDFTTPTQGADPAIDSNVNAAGETAPFTVADGDSNLTIDAGLVPLGSIGDLVFLDQNENGVRDPGEQLVAGATVVLLDSNGDQVGSVVTGADGAYSFTDLPAGDYVIVVTPPSGLVLGPQNAGNDDTVDSDIDPATGQSGVITVGIGENVPNVDAGLIPIADPPPPPPPAAPAPQVFGIPTITNAPPLATDPNPQAADFPPAPPLAVTGVNSNVLATLAISMMAVGGTLLIVGRRERDEE